jgi:prophage antirepressor-like protein
MSNIIPFNFESLPVRVIAGESGEPLFVAADGCQALIRSK